MKRKIGLVLLAISVGVACGVSEDFSQLSKGESTLSRVHTSTVDPQMNAASEEARSTLPAFIEAFLKPKPGQDGFAVKKLYVRNKVAEHIWITDLRIEGESFHGVSGNDSPETVGVRLGDPSVVPFDEITDWMYTDNDVLEGGFTIRVVYSRLTSEQRVRFDRDAPYRLQ